MIDRGATATIARPSSRPLAHPAERVAERERERPARGRGWVAATGLLVLTVAAVAEAVLPARPNQSQADGWYALAAVGTGIAALLCSAVAPEAARPPAPAAWWERWAAYGLVAWAGPLSAGVAVAGLLHDGYSSRAVVGAGFAALLELGAALIALAAVEGWGRLVPGGLVLGATAAIAGLFLAAPVEVAVVTGLARMGAVPPELLGLGEGTGGWSTWAAGVAYLPVGALFAAVAWGYRRRSGTRAVWAVLGAAGGVALLVAPLVSGVVGSG